MELNDFINYHANYSPLIESDNQYKEFVKSIWGLHDTLAPPPPDLLNPSYFGNGSNMKEVDLEGAPHVVIRNIIPSTAVSHGDVISWTQEPSPLESYNLNKNRMKRVKS